MTAESIAQIAFIFLQGSGGLIVYGIDQINRNLRDFIFFDYDVTKERGADLGLDQKKDGTLFYSSGGDRPHRHSRHFGDGFYKRLPSELTLALYSIAKADGKFTYLCP